MTADGRSATVEPDASGLTVDGRSSTLCRRPGGVGSRRFAKLIDRFEADVPGVDEFAPA